MNVTPDLLKKCTDGMTTTGIQPSPADIASVCDITGLDRPNAIILLKKWPGWGDAVTHYFEDPGAALREAAESRQWDSTQDTMPYADEGTLRHPSPSKGFIDLTQQHAEATRQIQDDQQEDEQIRRAMVESMKDMPQENGTIKAGQQFGPAQRAHYPEAQWALAPIASSREVVEHPPPAKRRRIMGSPAFLRGPPDGSYNAPLLTIYHSIPLAREALLFPPLEIYSYGHNPEWWAGTTDENTKSLSMQQSEPGDEDRRKYLAELQCLMGFLDNTTRAYGSVDALSDLRYFQYFKAQSDYTKFLETWQQAAMDEKLDNPLTQVFTSSATARGPNIGAVPESKELLSVEGQITDARTQVEVLDKILWSDSVNQPLDDIWIDQFGHILTMKVYNDNPAASGLGLAPTEVWYLDRYMHELGEVMWTMRQQCHRLSREQLRLTQARSRLAEMPNVRSVGPRIDIRKALENARDAMPIATSDLTRSDVRLVGLLTTIGVDQLQSQITNLLSNIEKKIKDLNHRQSELGAQKQQIMSDLTDPTNSSQTLRYKYVLQGVSTRENVTYVRKLNQDLIGMEDDEEPHEIWQWWRTAWGEASDIQPDAPVAHIEDSEDATDSVPFSVRKVSSKEVLEAVKNEYHTAILVYASEPAMQFRPTPLPASLRQFVEQDNRAFEDEVSLHHVRQSGRGRTWSNETNSTIMDENDPFEDNAYPRQPRDVTPMSTSTIRSLDGQPSPKRPRSSDDATQDTNLVDLPPSYEDIASNQQTEMVEKKGNRIGFFAEQMMQQVDEHEQKG